MAKKDKCPSTGKTRFDDAGAAKTVMLNIKTAKRVIDYIQNKRVNRGAGKPKQARVYYCRECCGWHLTSDDRRVSFKRYKKEWLLNSKQGIYNEEQAADWKKDSAPFPKTKT